MIDLLKNYKDLKNAPGYVGNIRYYLAKKKLDTLFIKWLSSNSDQVEQLLKKAQSGKLVARDQPNPLFLLHRVPLNVSSLHNSTLGFNNTITPPRMSMEDKQLNTKKSMHQTHTGGPLLSVSTILTKPLYQQKSLEVPQFYFANGKTLDKQKQKEFNQKIKQIVGSKQQINHEQVKSLVTQVLGLPNYFSYLVLIKGNSKNAEPTNNKPKTPPSTMLKSQFDKLWKILAPETPHSRAFLLLTTDPKKKFLVPDDFQFLFKQILAVHPGLQFLKDTPEFQKYYSDCVIARMYYMANRKYDYKMTFREFKKSNILASLLDIENEPDINSNKHFFSYEDFYVIYIKFWELDNDHDFQLTREELSKYSGYTLSRKTLERIFSQNVKKFLLPDKMKFEDFVWFILCVQDKTSQQSIEYWFRIMDLDGNGIITGYQLQYFYEEQSQRLNYMDSNLDFNFQNIICQMVDQFKPKNGIQFTLEDFLSQKSVCSIYINMLTDLNKLIGFQQRDAYEERNIKQENPEWTDWDRFVKPQYRRIQSSPDNDEGGQVLNWENDD